MSHAGSDEAEEMKLSGKSPDDLSDDSGVPSDDVSLLNSNQEDSQESCSLSENDLCSSETVDDVHSEKVLDDMEKSKLVRLNGKKSVILKKQSGSLHKVPEGSDSKSESDILSADCDSQQSSISSSSVNRKILKRKIEDDYSVNEHTCKKKKNVVVWDEVTIYYFSRTQGFTSVPSQGGSTLGMANHHNYKEKLSLNQHADKLKNIHKKILSKLRSKNETRSSASEDSEGDKKDEYSGVEDSDISDSDLENQFFLQPVSIRKRRAMLRASGVRKIDSHEKEECRDIRSSREFCGCDCKTICDPTTCLCNQAGIKCQVDRMSFPCGCTRDGCGNTSGRIEFNPSRVRTHFLRTLMQLEAEHKIEAQPTWKSNAENQLPHHIYFNYDNAVNYTIDSGTIDNYASISSDCCHQMNYETSTISSQLPYNATNSKVSNPDSAHLMLFNQGNNAVTHSVRDDDSYDIYASPYSPNGSSYSETSECSNDSVSPSHDENCSSTLGTSSFTSQFHSENQSVDYLSSNSLVFDSTHDNEEEQKYMDLSAATPSTTKYEPLSGLFVSNSSNYSNRSDNTFVFSQHNSYSIMEAKQSNSMFNGSSIKLGEPHKSVSSYSSSPEDLNIATSTSESSDNFGEIIKKTMVETVSV